MRQILTIFVFLMAINLGAQTPISPKLLNYLPICDENFNFENHHRINNRIVNQTLYNQMLSLEIDVYGNCAIGDTSWIEFENNTLQIWTGPIEKIYSDYNVIITETECDCYFHLYYDIQNINSIPDTILFNNKKLEITNNKYLPEVYIEIDSEKHLIYDTNGNYYEYEFFENGKLKKRRKEFGQIFQVYFFNENGELIKVYYDSKELEKGKRKTIKIN